MVTNRWRFYLIYCQLASSNCQVQFSKSFHLSLFQFNFFCHNLSKMSLKPSKFHPKREWNFCNWIVHTCCALMLNGDFSLGSFIFVGFSHTHTYTQTHFTHRHDVVIPSSCMYKPFKFDTFSLCVYSVHLLLNAIFRFLFFNFPLLWFCFVFLSLVLGLYCAFLFIELEISKIEKRRRHYYFSQKKFFCLALCEFRVR